MGSAFEGAIGRVRALEVASESLVEVGRGEADPAHSFGGVEAEGVAGASLGDAREGRAVAFDPGRTLARSPSPGTQLDARARHERAAR